MGSHEVHVRFSGMEAGSEATHVSPNRNHGVLSSQRIV
jgi:hypothetical protein